MSEQTILCTASKCLLVEASGVDACRSCPSGVRCMAAELERAKADLIDMRGELARLREENERLRGRDGNARIELCYEKDGNPFHREACQVVDVGVADNIYVVESAEVSRLREENERLRKFDDTPGLSTGDQIYEQGKVDGRREALGLTQEIVNSLCVVGCLSPRDSRTTPSQWYRWAEDKIALAQQDEKPCETCGGKGDVYGDCPVCRGTGKNGGGA